MQPTTTATPVWTNGDPHTRLLPESPPNPNQSSTIGVIDRIGRNCCECLSSRACAWAGAISGGILIMTGLAMYPGNEDTGEKGYAESFRNSVIVLASGTATFSAAVLPRLFNRCCKEPCAALTDCWKGLFRPIELSAVRVVMV